MLIDRFTFDHITGSICSGFLGDGNETRIDRDKFLCLKVFLGISWFGVGTLFPS